MTDSTGTGRPRVRDWIARGQQRLAHGLGVDEGMRTKTVLAMHENNARRAPGYWIQLLLSMGIATLGLVLDSTAVIIGAMLVSPLMGPIIELSMGFAVGSSLLVIRAFFRLTISVLVVIAGAALLTVSLPFHQVTSEIMTRTSPTALDLFVAVLCALAGAYTTVRPGADSTAAAAGTAIGIALVPPVCTIGFGIGTGSASIASGAALLFTANFSGILVFAVLVFLLLGFDQVDAESIEAEYVPLGRADRAASWAHRVIGGLFGSRHGFALRLFFPAAFLAAIFVPLSRALDDVTWEIRTREAIRRIVIDESPGSVQTALVVDQQSISLRLLVIGTNANAVSLESRLARRIRDAAKVEPTVVVIPVADSRMLASQSAATATAAAETSRDQFAALTRQVSAALAGAWPPPVGKIAGWELSLSESGTPILAIQHLGDGLGDAGVALLSAALSERLKTPLEVRDVPVTGSVLVRRGTSRTWVDSAESLLGQIAATDSLVACVRAPAGAAGRASDRATLTRLQARVAGAPARFTMIEPGPWSIQAAHARCPDDAK